MLNFAHYADSKCPGQEWWSNIAMTYVAKTDNSTSANCACIGPVSINGVRTHVIGYQSCSKPSTCWVARPATLPAGVAIKSATTVIYVRTPIIVFTITVTSTLASGGDSRGGSFGDNKFSI